MSDSYQEQLAKKITRSVMMEIAGYYQVSAKFPKVYKDVLKTVTEVLKEEDIE